MVKSVLALRSVLRTRWVRQVVVLKHVDLSMFSIILPLQIHKRPQDRSVNRDHVNALPRRQLAFLLVKSTGIGWSHQASSGSGVRVL